MTSQCRSLTSFTMFARTFSLFSWHYLVAVTLVISTSFQLADAQNDTNSPAPNPNNPYNIPDVYMSLPGIQDVAIPADAVFRGWEPSLSSYCSATQLKSYSEHLAKYTTINDVWLTREQKPPCCGQCRYGANTAQLIYWPEKLDYAATAVVSESLTL